MAVERVNCTKLPEEWLSPSLEAFSLLCVENFFERVKRQVKNEDPVARGGEMDRRIPGVVASRNRPVQRIDRPSTRRQEDTPKGG